MRDHEEDFWHEQVEIDAWLSKIEAGETVDHVPIKGDWSTVSEVATRHRCSPKTIRARIYDGSLKAVDHSPNGSNPRQRRYRIHRDAEEAWLRAKGEANRQMTTRKAAARSTFKDMIE
jgi:hypothetical protein